MKSWRARARGETVLLASTGFCGRELYAIADRANHLYMVGSMGCVTPLALGLALARPDLKVIALDGDGAALMRLGALATVGATAPRNFWHLLLDNSAHESTGGQATVSRDRILRRCGRGMRVSHLSGYGFGGAAASLAAAGRRAAFRATADAPGNTQGSAPGPKVTPDAGARAFHAAHQHAGAHVILLNPRPSDLERARAAHACCSRICAIARRSSLICRRRFRRVCWACMAWIRRNGSRY